MNAGSTRPKQGADPTFPRLLGDRLCLNFANSVENPMSPHPQDFLRSYTDLVRWGRHVGELSVTDVLLLLAEGERHPDAATSTLTRALALRDAIHRVFQAIGRGESPTAPDLAKMHEEHLAALSHTQLTATADGFDLIWTDDEPDLYQPIWPIVRSAIDLLLNGDPTRIKECSPPAGGCGWLFYDESRNASRRWCSMEGCGSLAKMRRYRSRRRVPPLPGLGEGARG